MFQMKTSEPVSEEVNLSSMGVTDTEIVIGSSAALSGHAGTLGTNYLHGAMAYINQVNEDGGIHGRTIRVVSYDDMYNPPQTVANTQKLINEDKVFLLFNYVGTPTTLKIIPIVEEAKIPLVGIFSGAQVLRVPFRKNIFSIRASYFQETETAIQHYTKTLGLKKIAVFYQSDAYGIDGLEGTKRSLQKYGLEPVALGTYNRGTMDVEDAVARIANSEAEAVVIVGTYGPAAKFVTLMKDRKPDMYFHSVSFVGTEEFVKELGDNTSRVCITEVVPSLAEAGLPDFLLKYEERLQKYYPDDEVTFGGVEGYVNTKVILDALQNAGATPTREGFVKALESYQDESGLGIEFSKNDHQGLDTVYLIQIQNGKYTRMYTE